MSQEIYDPHDRDEVERLQQFRFAVPAEFFKRIDRSLLTCPSAFDAVSNWNGKFPGPCAFGPTNGGKTRAAWSALERLWVKNRQQFAWFPVRRMVTLLSKADEKGDDEKFFRNHDRFSILFVDDIDKINWSYESHMSALFSFYDWVYRQNKPCITTTNKDPAWWAERMGDAFARRLFEGAHFAVKF
jgi:DNA replication protein DnaC